MTQNVNNNDSSNTNQVTGNPNGNPNPNKPTQATSGTNVGGKKGMSPQLMQKILENKENRQKDRKSKFFRPNDGGNYKLQIYDVVGRVKRDIKDKDGNVTKTIYPYQYKIVDLANIENGIMSYDAPSTVSEQLDMGLENGYSAFLLSRKGSTQMNTKYTVMALPREQELDLSALNLKDNTIEKGEAAS